MRPPLWQRLRQWVPVVKLIDRPVKDSRVPSGRERGVIFKWTIPW